MSFRISIKLSEGDGMDYRDYKALIGHYHELTVCVDPEETKESLIRKLMDNSFEKKQILRETNAIIQAYIVNYERNPSLLDEQAVAVLSDFAASLMPSDDTGDYVDPAISLRIYRLLLGYYQAEQNLDETVRMVCLCAMFDIMLMEHRDASEASPYTHMAERYLKDFDRLSDENKRRLVNCWLLCVYNQKDLTFGVRKYRDIQRQFEDIRRRMGDGFARRNFIGCQTYTLEFAMIAWYRATAPNAGPADREPLKDLEEHADVIRELADELRQVIQEDQAHELILDHVTTRYYITQADYYLGRLTMEEMLARSEAFTRPREDYSVLEQCTWLFSMHTCYLDNLSRCGWLDQQTKLDKTLEVIAYVRRNMADAIKGLSQLSSYVSVFQSHRFMLELMSAASSIVDFDYFERIVLDITVYANKELYVHTMTVKEICQVLLESLLDCEPEYLDGVAGRSWTYWRDHRAEAMHLMEKSALLHDVGKFFCLDFVNNASRNLTDDEFEYIKYHPTNFSAIYQGAMTPEIECIRDCARLHHLWHDETGGYPREKHTANQPFVNILTIADCIDAATDNIGRPYGTDKTLEQLMGEFDNGRDTRYCSAVSDLLHTEEIRQRISHVIGERRKEIYCDIYFSEQ